MRSEGATPARKRRLPTRDGWIVGLATALAIACWNGSTWFMGALVGKAGLAPTTVGLILAIELAATGITMAAMTPIIGRLPLRRWIVIGGLVVIACQLLSAAPLDLPWLFAVRTLSGIASGAVYALASAAGAAADDPDKTFADAATIQLFISLVIGPVLGTSLDHFGQAGVFAGTAAYGGVCLAALLAMRLPAAPVARIVAAHGETPAATAPAVRLGMLAIVALFGLSTNGLFLFLERLAEQAGLTGTQFGLWLSVSAPTSTVGPIIAGLVGTRFGRAAPTALTLALTGLTAGMIFSLGSPAGFGLGYTLYASIYWCCYPYLFGLSAALDRSGRLAAAVGSMLILSGAAGNYLAAAVAERFGPQAFGWVCVGTGFLAALIAVPLAARARD